MIIAASFGGKAVVPGRCAPWRILHRLRQRTRHQGRTQLERILPERPVRQPVSNSPVNAARAFMAWFRTAAPATGGPGTGHKAQRKGDREPGG